MASHTTDGITNTGMTGGGRNYANCAAAATTSVKATAGRLVRLIILSGTGSIQANDNAAGNTTGQLLFSKATVAVGDIYLLDVPTTAGIAVTMGAATTALAVYI